ncbi:MAG: serine/threonine protein kinase, partial [Acidobacteria bacterium]|nr:serine/threonine protein kinase [Acidobacteriota bacterium]
TVLELFQEVCRGVHHAHRNLIIHRDLKPGNILVAGDGRPVLLDFGIAKLLEEPIALDQAVRTVEGLHFLTPAFASPEQIRGKPLTTATDVYSLGVVLYLLLAGRPPYQLEGLDPKNLYETVCEREPLVLSRSLEAAGRLNPDEQTRDRAIAAARGESVQGLRQRLRGDLEILVSKALRKEPERRYASVAALAEDIDHTLRHRPIRARKETVGYRFSKLVRRHPSAAAATAALFLAVVLGVFSTLRATWLARAQRDQARISQAEAERVTDFMVGLFEVSSPEVSLGEKVSAQEILDRGSELIARELDEQPLSRARLLQAMGRAYQGLGLYPRAQGLLRQAVADRAEALGEGHPDVVRSRMDLARPLLDGGDHAAASRVLEEVLANHRNRGQLDGPEAATALNLLAMVRLRQGDVTEAEELFRQALEIRSARLGPDHLATLESLNGLAEVLFARQQTEEAGELFRQVLRGRRQQLSNDHPDVVLTLNNLAVVQQARGDLAGAEETMKEVIERRRRLYGEEHPHVALAYNNLGQVLSFQGKHEEAEEWLERALALSRRLYGETHPRVADLQYSLGLVLDDLGRASEAESRLEASLALRREALGTHHPDVGQSLVALASLHHRLGNSELALQEAQESLEILQAALPAGDYRLSSPSLQLGLLLAAQDRCEEAVPYLNRARELREAFLPAGHPALGEVLKALESCS